MFLRTYRNVCRKKLPNVELSALGAVKHKQREEAIAIQLHIMHRSSSVGVSHMSQLLDLTNAYYCPEFNLLDEHFECFKHTENNFGKIAYNSVVENDIAIIPCSDGTHMLNAGTGVMPGLSEATRIFNWAYSKPLGNFIDKARNQMSLTPACSPVSKT